MTTDSLKIESSMLNVGRSPLIQRSFDLPIPDNRLLISVDTARVFLNRDERAIIDLIEEGRLQYAWNIASPNSTKIERRIHRDSLRCYRAGLRDAAPEADYYQIFLHSREHVRLSELYAALNCSRQHALGLMRAGCFGSAAANLIKQLGQRVSPTVPRAAVIAFLKSRRLP